MTNLKALARDFESVIFTEESLSYEIAAVSGYRELAPELLLEELFWQLAQQACSRTNKTPMTVWLVRSGSYTTRLEAVRNGEQLIVPALITWKMPK